MGTPYIKLRDPGECRTYKFTANKISELQQYVIAFGKVVEFTDASETGLKLVIYGSGKMSWRHRWTDKAGRKQFFTIGEAPAISPDTARQIVRNRKSRIAQGLNPENDEPVLCATFEEFIKDFLVFARRKYKTVKDVESRIRVWLLPNFAKMKISEIRKVDVIRFREEVRDKKSAITSNRSLSLLSSIMARAVDLELIERNPCVGVKKYYEGESRSRRMNTEELGRFMKVLISRLGEQSAKALFLLIATAKRRMEILAARWSMIDLVLRILTIPDPKNRRTDYVALNTQAYALLVAMHQERDVTNDWVFPSDSKSGHLTEVRRTFRSIMLQAGIPSIRLHDLRRTTASIIAESGASPLELMKILNHKDMRSTLVYTRLANSTIAKTSEIAAQKMAEALNA